MLCLWYHCVSGFAVFSIAQLIIYSWLFYPLILHLITHFHIPYFNVLLLTFSLLLAVFFLLLLDFPWFLIWIVSPWSGRWSTIAALDGDLHRGRVVVRLGPPLRSCTLLAIVVGGGGGSRSREKGRGSGLFLNEFVCFILFILVYSPLCCQVWKVIHKSRLIDWLSVLKGVQKWH